MLRPQRRGRRGLRRGADGPRRPGPSGEGRLVAGRRVPRGPHGPRHGDDGAGAPRAGQPHPRDGRDGQLRAARKPAGLQRHAEPACGGLPRAARAPGALDRPAARARRRRGPERRAGLRDPERPRPQAPRPRPAVPHVVAPLARRLHQRARHRDALDDIALELGETPFAFRLRHLDDPRARAVLDRLEAETGGRAARLLSPEGPDGASAYARYKGIGGYCAVLARIAVEDDVRVTDVVCVADIGEAVSPDGARNQIEGGIVQAISWTLKEQVRFDGAAVAADSWLDYPILRFSEVPRVRVVLIERPEEAPLGAGEISQGPAAAAVANAVRAGRRRPRDGAFRSRATPSSRR